MGRNDAFAQPLSARSVVLSLLLGSQPPRMSARQLTELGEHFGIAAATTRVALSRMTAAGDLVQSDRDYALAARHLQRQAAIDFALAINTAPTLNTRDHGGKWRMAIVVDRGRSAPMRAELRKAMQTQRFAELREGVWLRPDNLTESSERTLDEVRCFLTVPDHEAQLCAELWDLDQWAASAREILDVMCSADPPMRRLTAAAAAVRLLRTDPILPVDLAPADWPAGELHERYNEYRKEISPAALQVSTKN